jgi:hypothetical protein
VVALGVIKQILLDGGCGGIGDYQAQLYSMVAVLPLGVNRAFLLAAAVIDCDRFLDRLLDKPCQILRLLQSCLGWPYKGSCDTRPEH